MIYRNLLASRRSMSLRYIRFSVAELNMKEITIFQGSVAFSLFMSTIALDEACKLSTSTCTSQIGDIYTWEI